MTEVLIFGGTTEGRLLAEFCQKRAISCEISVATEYGASLLPDGVSVHIGRLDSEGMQTLMRQGSCTAVVDATHPYAAEATENIRHACETLEIPYFRLVRSSGQISGEAVYSDAELIALLNACDTTILSTLGSKSLSLLTEVRDFRRRIWVRVLPSEQIFQQAAELGFCTSQVFAEQGPFSTEQNIAHIRQSGAGILLTKESGAVGGYPEKIAAAAACSIRVITLARPVENGLSLEEIKEVLVRR